MGVLLFSFVIGVVTTMLNQPEDPDIANFDINLEKTMNANPYADSRNIIRNEKFRIRKKIADRYGLTVFNPTETEKILQANTVPSESNMSLDTYIDTANDFLHNQDIQITDDNSVLTRDGATGQTAEDRITDSYRTRLTIRELVDATAAEPKEYTDMLGIKQYILTTHVDSAGAYITPSLNADVGPSIVFSIDHMGAAVDTINHEQSHRLDFLISGDTYSAQRHDPTFEALSANAPYGKVGKAPAPGKPDTRKDLLATKEGWLRMDDFNDVRTELANRLSEHYGQPDCMDTAVQSEKQLMAAGERTVLTTDYSAEANVVERKAELMRNITQGSKYNTLLSPFLRRLGEQLRNRLAQLYMYRPRLARFFIDMAQRPDINSDSSSDDPKFLEKRCEFNAEHPEQQTHDK